MKPHGWLVLAIVGALIGLIFAGLSTYDFVQHLDRQVHNVHCSFIPGLGHDTVGPSGCQVAMMSPYSSVFRSSLWGGIPIALPAVCVFAFLVCIGIDLVLARCQENVRATGFFALAAALPLVASAVMAYISITKLGTACKLCVGIYLASVACFVGAVGSWRRAVSVSKRGRGQGMLPLRPWTLASPVLFFAGAFLVGVLFVGIPVALYAAAVPDHARFVGTCDVLARPDDPYGVMVPLGEFTPGAVPTIEVLDPLCPACRGFEQRLEASGLATRLQRRMVLFPLDNTCNWMVTEAVHPGACVVSEAVLCAGARASEVVAWAFENQDQIRTEAARDRTAASRLVRLRFPDLARCIGSPTAQSKLNKSLRWVVQNGLTVVTPQVYVAGVKLCDEDVDLGLEYALNVMLKRYSTGQLVPARPSTVPPQQNAAGAREGIQ